MQLDIDEDDEPFFKPQVVQTEPLIPRNNNASSNNNGAPTLSRGSEDDADDPQHPQRAEDEPSLS